VAAAPRKRAASDEQAPWQPDRLELGQGELVRYIGPNTGFFRTWLVHDGDNVVGGAGVRSQGMDDFEFLELWFYERESAADAGETPAVALAAPDATASPALRARLGGTHVIPATTGRAFVMKTARLRLEVELDDVVAREDGRGLNALSLRIRPRPA
jgi:hypothetical protein